jgi:hypothetical protein
MDLPKWKIEALDEWIGVAYKEMVHYSWAPDMVEYFQGEVVAFSAVLELVDDNYKPGICQVLNALLADIHRTKYPRI